MKRGIVIQHNDGTPDLELELAKANIVHAGDKGFVYLEQMADGKWRLTYTSGTIKDFSKVAAFKVLREDDSPNGPVLNEASLHHRLAEIKRIVDTIPMGGSKEGRPDYVHMLSSDKVARLRELTNFNPAAPEGPVVETSLGKLTASPRCDPYYPSIVIKFNGRDVAWVEVDEQAEGGPKLQVLHWNRHYDDGEEAEKHIINLTPPEDESDGA